MNILAFDTCLDKMYVLGKSSNGNSVSKIIETTSDHYHSAFLISTIREVLQECDLTPNDINLIATNVGPGSFTGIRACTTVARVFSQGGAKDIKTIGVSSLEILSRLNDTQEPSLVALDARKEMAYVAAYDNKKEILPPQTMPLEDLKKRIVYEHEFVVSDDKLAPQLGGISYQQTDKDLGKILVEIALEKIAQDCETDWRKLHPLYIQPPPVTIKN